MRHARPPSRPPPRGGEARRTLSSFSSAAAAADAADSDNATPKKKKPKKRGPKSPKARKFGHLRQGKGLPATTSKEAGVRCDVIAHRGASGHLPGHTLPSMEEALRAGADWIELDVMPTKDGTLIVAHDVVLDHNTNAAEVFPGRARTKHAPANDDEDHNIHGFWVDDFTIDEIKQLDVGQSEQTRAQVSSLDTTSALGTLVAAHSFKVPTVVEAGAFVRGPYLKCMGGFLNLPATPAARPPAPTALVPGLRITTTGVVTMGLARGALLAVRGRACVSAPARTLFWPEPAPPAAALAGLTLAAADCTRW